MHLIVALLEGLADPWDGFLRCDAETLPCLSATQQRACAYRPLDGYVVSRHVFVDGAFYKGCKRHKGGWAAVFVAELCTPAGTVFAFDGYAGGPLIDFTRRPVQAEYSSYDAEAAAMLVVLTWHLSQPRALITTVHFDANAVGQAAEGLAAPRDPGEGLGLAGRARCVAQVLEAQGRAPTYSWVKGHAGMLWNEVADRIAKAFAMETLPAIALPELFWDFVASRSLPWAWLVADRSGAFPTSGSSARVLMKALILLLLHAFLLTRHGVLQNPQASLACPSCPSMCRPCRASGPSFSSSSKTSARYYADCKKLEAAMTFSAAVEAFWNLPPLLMLARAVAPCLSRLRCPMSEWGAARFVLQNSTVAVYMLAPSCWQLRSGPLSFSAYVLLVTCRIQDARWLRSTVGGLRSPTKVGFEVLAR